MLNRRTFIKRGALLTGSVLTGAETAMAGTYAAAAKPTARPNTADWAGQADQIVQDMMKDHGAPGAVVAVVKDGELAFAKGYGVKRLQERGQPDENTVFYIGSLSKAITAVGLMLMVQSSKLNLDALASKYIKDLPTTWQKITVKQFMVHASGIPDIPRDERAGSRRIEEVYRQYDGKPLDFEPGSKLLYNNFNFAVAGHLIERISGKSYMDYMNRSVFGPLSMKFTGIGNLSTNHAYGYEQDKDRKLRESMPDVIPMGVPSGGLATTLTDLLKLEKGLRPGGLLKPDTMRLMTTPYPKLAGTPGWFFRKGGESTVISKDGAAGGFSSYFTFIPNKGHAVIMIRNLQGKNVPTAPSCNRLLEIACGVPMRGA